MATRESTLLMRLVDGVSGPSAKVARSLNQTGLAARSMAGSGGLATKALMWGAGLAATYFTVDKAKEAIKVYANEEAHLLDLGNKFGASRLQMWNFHEDLNKLSSATLQSYDSLMEAADEAARYGRNIDQVKELIEPTAKVATAYNLQAKGVMAVNDALMNQMHLSKDQIVPAWDAIASAARHGGMNVQEFSAGLPQLTAAAERFGWKGPEGFRKSLALVQMIRPHVGSATEAMAVATDTMTGMFNTKVRTAFKKAGIDIVGVVSTAVKKGQDPLEAFFNAANKMTKGHLDQLSRYGVNMEAIRTSMFAISQMSPADRVALFKSIMTNTGETAQKFAARMQGADRTLKEISSTINNIQTELGRLLTEMGAPEGALQGLQMILGALEKIKEAIQWIENSKWGINASKEDLRHGRDVAGANDVEYRKKQVEDAQRTVDYLKKTPQSVQRDYDIAFYKSRGERFAGMGEQPQTQMQVVLGDVKDAANAMTTMVKEAAAAATAAAQAKTGGALTVPTPAPPTILQPGEKIGPTVPPLFGPVPAMADAGQKGAEAGQALKNAFVKAFSGVEAEAGAIISRIKNAVSNITVNITPHINTPNTNGINGDGGKQLPRTN